MKLWRCAGDERTCAPCAEQDGAPAEAGRPKWCTNPDGCRCIVVDENTIEISKFNPPCARCGMHASDCGCIGGPVAKEDRPTADHEYGGGK